MCIISFFPSVRINLIFHDSWHITAQAQTYVWHNFPLPRFNHRLRDDPREPRRLRVEPREEHLRAALVGILRVESTAVVVDVGEGQFVLSEFSKREIVYIKMYVALMGTVI